MFGKMMNETLGKITFWVFYIGFHLTFFIQHFLGLWGMPRRVFTYLPNQGWDTANFVSSIGALLMAVGVLLLVVNMVMSFFSKEKLSADPWGDGRSLEWAVASPPPEYNFKQLPLVRSLDPVWYEKMNGNKELVPAEPLGDIHMPNGSFVPFVISLGLFIAGFGVMYHDLGTNKLALGVFIVGMLITFGSMFVRSIKDDHGYHIHKEDLEREGGLKA